MTNNNIECSTEKLLCLDRINQLTDNALDCCPTHQWEASFKMVTEGLVWKPSLNPVPCLGF